MLAFAPPTLRGLCRPVSPPTSLRPSSASASCALRVPRCPRSCGTHRPANGERSDAEIGKPPPKAKKEVPFMKKPSVMKTQLRDMIILPEMVGGIVGRYNSMTFKEVEIKPEIIGYYLGEFSIINKSMIYGWLGIGATYFDHFT
ncbi:hypothetical protein A6R68_09461 [Neotoma lepida]|uniref:40S ribosomal protein S15 n=1 Tax=Neotoma lepida TaxID=56216 RepID=A0A1A6G0P6_NEOLE|nr:hypothetical protein A6R68_09461 [Neotoma lepida]